jgi:uncharacterized protein
MNKHMDVILIPSTLCNLRCSYCYELSKLGDRARLDLASLELIFVRLALWFRSEGVPSARFIWHGGEPLLLPPEYYWRAFEMQQACFADTGTSYRNVTQTNLTVLDEARADLIARGFDVTGVSLDLFGSLRIDAGGTCREQTAIRHLDSLLERGVRLNGVTVLTRANRYRIRDIFEFYRRREMGFRLLPLHGGDFAAGQWFDIAPEDTLRAFCTLADLWLADQEAPLILPIAQVVKAVLEWHRDGTVVEPYDKGRWDAMVAIDREGFVYGYSDIHDRSRSYGNLLTAPFAELHAGSVRARVVAETRARVREVCAGCPHAGRTCNTYPVAEGVDDVWQTDDGGAIRCTAFRGLFDHVERRLREAGVIAA